MKPDYHSLLENLPVQNPNLRKKKEELVESMQALIHRGANHSELLWFYNFALAELGRRWCPIAQEGLNEARREINYRLFKKNEDFDTHRPTLGELVDYTRAVNNIKKRRVKSAS